LIEQRIIEKIRIANHFEYLGPLTRSELFFDRNQELQDALVVCGQIVQGTVGGVLVLGGRGSGKTSFLNEVRRELSIRKIPNTKISLDEGMVKQGNEMLFIQNLLTELVKASQSSGLIETSLATKVIDVLTGALNKVEEIGIDVAGFNLVAKASKELVSSQFPYTVLRDGLVDFLNLIEKNGSDKTARGAILLLDEGDILTLNRNLLQILRNVFQETPRIGLVVSASNKILSQVSDVFSPIPRFFRKIELGPYPADSIVYDAIKGPLELTTKQLAQQGIELDVIHRSFDRIVAQISGQMPMEINMLCHFAFDLGTRRPSIERDGKMSIYMRADRELFDEAIKQLVGSREYASFINELDPNEVSCLVLLSKSLENVSVDELTTLISLHELGDALTDIAITDVTKRIEKNPEERETTKKLLDSISQKAQKHKINVLTSTLMGKPRFAIEDQWVRAYFKYGWSDVDIDLELGLKPRFGGVRVFGDPAASVLHSLLFPRLCDDFGHGESFKAHFGRDSGKWLRAARDSKIACISYKRIATDGIYHIAFQVRAGSNIEWLKNVVALLMSSLEKAGLAQSYTYSVWPITNYSTMGRK
jgi:hypothetical protein